jgi:hypothetical protein
MIAIDTKNSRIGFGAGICGLAALLLVGLALVLPAAASAQASGQDCAGPTGDQYCPNTQVLTGSGSGSGGDPQDPSGTASGGLPFTGFDIALSLAAGAGLLGAGLALRRASRARDVTG